VFAEPEIEGVGLMPADAFLVIASDGVFEFLSSQSVVDMVGGPGGGVRGFEERLQGGLNGPRTEGERSRRGSGGGGGGGGWARPSSLHPRTPPPPAPPPQGLQV
jgi:hypothetical protein